MTEITKNTNDISGARDTDKFRNYSNASKLRQSAIPKEIRVARSRAAALARWKGVPQIERRAHAMKMLEVKYGGGQKS